MQGSKQKLTEKLVLWSCYQEKFSLQERNEESHVKYFPSQDINENVQQQMCSTDENSWCIRQQAKTKNTLPYYVHKRLLSQIVRDVTDSIYEQVNLEGALKLCELTRSWIYTKE